jgi:hypothetical protein
MLKTASIGLMATNVWLTPFIFKVHTVVERLILWKKQLAKLSCFVIETWGLLFVL